MLTLPELLLQIFEYCSPQDLYRWQRVSRQWAQLLSDHDSLFWKPHCGDHPNFSHYPWRQVFKESFILKYKLAELFNGRPYMVQQLPVRLLTSSLGLTSEPQNATSENPQKEAQANFRKSNPASSGAVEESYLAIVSQNAATCRVVADRGGFPSFQKRMRSSSLSSVDDPALMTQQSNDSLLPSSSSSTVESKGYSVTTEWDLPWSCVVVHKGFPPQRLYSHPIATTLHTGYLFGSHYIYTAFTNPNRSRAQPSSTRIGLLSITDDSMTSEWVIDLNLKSSITQLQASQDLVVCQTETTLYLLKRADGSLLSVLRDQASYNDTDVILTPKSHILVHTRGKLFVYNSLGNLLCHHLFSPYEWVLTPTKALSNDHLILRIHRPNDSPKNHRILLLDVSTYTFYEVKYRLEDIPRGPGYFLFKSEPLYGRGIDYLPFVNSH